MSAMPSDDPDQVLAKLQRAISKADARAVARLLERSPALLASRPGPSADLLALALRVASREARVTLLQPAEQARAALESQRAIVDLLLAHGASVDGDAQSRDHAPVAVAAMLAHPMFLELLLARGADPSTARGGLDAMSAVLQRRERRAPEHRSHDDAFIALLERHGSGKGVPART